MARSDELNNGEEIVRLLVTQLRLQLDNQAAVILELNRAGFGPSRIAELLGTTPGTVNVAIQRAKQRATRKPAKSSSAEGEG
jgi:DNA-directed RNA polymerase specialized sigma24 family protein